ncbi:MAG TPA: M1 family metallopeptidase, partial [Chitinophagaceae bacterium]
MTNDIYSTNTNLVKKTILLFLLLPTLLPAFSQYWQQEVNYTITVSLNDKEHSLTGYEKMEYINNSPDTLTFIWFHLWPNAYKNDRTAFSDQRLENGDTKFYFSNKEQKGYINKLDFKVNNITAELQDHPEHIDIAKLVLPSPLPPGQRITITTPFHVKLPFNFSRGGHDQQSYQATQWYPKPAVYDKNGWHPMPYLDQGEFYSEFGSFDVSITVPKNYVVAATGELQDAEEKEWLKTRTNDRWGLEYRKANPVKKFYTSQAIGANGVARTITTKNKDTVPNIIPASDALLKTLRYKQTNIHDFAWFADKRFIVNNDTCLLASGRIINVYSYYNPIQERFWKNSVQNSKDAVRHYSQLVGEYPYNVVSVVYGPDNFGGGMEYPTITVISAVESSKDLDRTIAHEIGHNWFYGILASNERKYPWMDEGINSYYDASYMQKKDDHFSQRFEQMLLETFIATKKDQPIATSSEKFSAPNYALVAYYKTSQWLAMLEKELGTETFNKAMQEYYRRWQFKHPQPEDFKKVMEEVSGKDLTASFALLSQPGALPAKEKKGIGLQSPVGAVLGTHADKNTAVTILPVLGFNSYDKLMLGAAITNLRLPPNRLQFLLTPMYGFGSKQLNGIGFINYSSYPSGIFRKIDIGINASMFSADRFTDDNGKKYFLGFQKLVPGIRFTFKEKDLRNSFHRFLQFKSFIIEEDELRFLSGEVTTKKVSRTLNQLQFVIENNRVLYPYSGELKVEQGEDFLRTAFTGKYFFNYPKEGGLDVRLFAGKFIY